MKSLWQQIGNIGIDNAMHLQQAKRIRLANQVSVSFSFIAFCYIFVFYFLGFAREALQVVLITVLMTGTMWFNYKGRYTFAKFWLILVTNLAVLLFAFYFGRKGGLHLIFFAVVCLSWLFFEVTEIAKLVAGILIPLTCFYIFAISPGEALVAIDPAVQQLLYLSLITVTFLILGLCISFFTFQNNKAEKTLYAVNKELQYKQEALEQQQEELRQINEELTHQAEVLKASEEELRVQEEELRHVNAELEEKTEAIELARRALVIKAEELEQASRYKSEFLANMSHELRTPLNSVLILANLLKENKTGNLTEKQTDYARIIHKSGTDLLNLINDILDLSKIEAGKIEMHFEDVRINELAADMEELFKMMAKEKNIIFDIRQENARGTIKTDKQRLEQVIKNLLSNAFKFTDKGGSIGLSFTGQDDYLQIAVKDTGIGIPPEKQQLIFEAFQQADGSTNRRYGGTGLGLSISRELTKKLGGKMTLESVQGAGSTFTLTIPVHPHEAHVSAVENIQEVKALPVLDDIKEQQEVSDDKNKIKTGEQVILIIEDDAQFASVLQDFAHEKGHKTIIALKGDEGLYYARKYNPVAILLDLNLPIIDGRSILRILKSEETLKHIPVHVISADDQSNVLMADIESYFRKPLQANDLEKAFSGIEQQIRSKYNNILIVSANKEINKHTLELLTAEKHIAVVYDNVKSIEEAINQLGNKKYDCLVVDIEKDINNGLKLLQQLKQAAGNDIYIMVYLDMDISASEEMQLRRYSSSIIRRSSYALDRITDEVALFLHKIKHANPVTVPVQYEKMTDNVLKGKKVLLADDDMRNVFALTALLEEQGMVIVAAENGKEALVQLSEHPDTDIVLMDIMMPEMDGYEAMRQIRKELNRKELPVIALTAKAMTGDREKCIEAGASDYITKPVDSNKLFSLMRVWLS